MGYLFCLYVFAFHLQQMAFRNISKNRLLCFINLVIPKSYIMKTYKVRSLIYLGCFIASAIVYYNFEQEHSFPSDSTIEMADHQFEDATEQDNLSLKEELQGVQ